MDSNFEHMNKWEDLIIRFFNNELSNPSFINTLKFGPYYAMGNLDLSTGTIHNNRLWARLGKSQIIITEQGQRYENSQIIDSLYSEHFSKTVSNVLSEESRIDVTEAYELSDVENLLSDDEVDQLYSAIIEKEIL